MSNATIEEILTAILTPLLPNSYDKTIKRSVKVVLILLNKRDNQSYLTQLAEEIGEPKQRTIYLISKMVQCGILQAATRIDTIKPIKLSSEIFTRLKKTLGSINNSSLSSSPDLTPSSSMSKIDSYQRAHRLLTIFSHNLTAIRFKRLRGKWTHNDSRVTITTNFDNDFFHVVFTATKCMVYSPVVFGGNTIEEYAKIRPKLSTRVGKLIRDLERKLVCKFDPLEEKLLVKNGSKNSDDGPLKSFEKSEMELRDPFHRYVNKQFREAGFNEYKTADWKFSNSYQGIELIDGWKDEHREGIGIELMYDGLLHLPETFDSFTADFYSAAQAQKVELSQVKQTQYELTDTLNHISEHMNTTNNINRQLVHQLDQLATRNDIENIVRQHPGSNLQLTATQQKIYNALTNDWMTFTQLASKTGLSKSKISYHIKELLVSGLMEKETQAPEGRGRPEVSFKRGDR